MHARPDWPCAQNLCSISGKQLIVYGGYGQCFLVLPECVSCIIILINSVWDSLLKTDFLNCEQENLPDLLDLAESRRHLLLNLAATKFIDQLHIIACVLSMHVISQTPI